MCVCRYELCDIGGHVCEFSQDQHGSRFIQQKLETATPEELSAALAEVLPRATHLMTDVFGNYVVQKFLEHASPEQRLKIAEAMEGQVREQEWVRVVGVHGSVRVMVSDNM